MRLREKLARAWMAFRGKQPMWTPAKDRMDRGAFFTRPPVGDDWIAHNTLLAKELSAGRGTGVVLALLDFTESQRLSALEAMAESSDETSCLRRRDLYRAWDLVLSQLSDALTFEDKLMSKERQRVRMTVEKERSQEIRAAGRSDILG